MSLSIKIDENSNEYRHLHAQIHTFSEALCPEVFSSDAAAMHIFFDTLSRNGCSGSVVSAIT